MKTTGLDKRLLLVTGGCNFLYHTRATAENVLESKHFRARHSRNVLHPRYVKNAYQYSHRNNYNLNSYEHRKRIVEYITASNRNRHVRSVFCDRQTRPKCHKLLLIGPEKVDRSMVSIGIRMIKITKRRPEGNTSEIIIIANAFKGRIQNSVKT